MYRTPASQSAYVGLYSGTRFPYGQAQQAVTFMVGLKNPGYSLFFPI
jgi:hypothetical protein